jgi:hypothetical protein
VSVFVLLAGARGPFEDRTEVAMQGGGDLAAPGAGCERDTRDQGTDSLGRLITLLPAPQCFREVFHFAAVDAPDIRMNVGDIDRRG